jgi:hypothetical protein
MEKDKLFLTWRLWAFIQAVFINKAVTITQAIIILQAAIVSKAVIVSKAFIVFQADIVSKTVIVFKAFIIAKAVTITKSVIVIQAVIISKSIVMIKSLTCQIRHCKYPLIFFLFFSYRPPHQLDAYTHIVPRPDSVEPNFSGHLSWLFSLDFPFAYFFAMEFRSRHLFLRPHIYAI